jgi:hypothetical protein
VSLRRNRIDESLSPTLLHFYVRGVMHEQNARPNFPASFFFDLSTVAFRPPMLQYYTVEFARAVNCHCR